MATNRRLLVATGIFHPEPGGPATYLYELLPHLQARGWQIEVITYSDSPISDKAYPYPVRRIPRRALPLRLAAYALAARPLLRRADLIYQHTLGLPLLGVRAPRVLKVVGDQAWERAIRRGWIAPTEDIDTFQTRRYGGVVALQQAARSREVRAMDGIIVPSHYLRHMVIGWGADPARVQVICNALPPAPGISLTRAQARAQLGLGDEPLLLTAARLYPWKGVQHLIEALRDVPDAHLLVAGDGPQGAALRQQAQAAGLGGRVTFLGQVARARLEIYRRAADYVVLYSGYEGLSHVLLESLRAGTPVIASDKGGNPEVVTHEVNGLLVPYVDVAALAAALRRALRPGVRDRLAAQTATGLHRFDFGAMIDQTAAALASFAGDA
jgi:glycosyltransferase involved in cell wall biosynthesis